MVLPLSRARAQAIIDETPRDAFGCKTSLRTYMDVHAARAVTDYLRTQASGTQSFNDVIRHCARGE